MIRAEKCELRQLYLWHANLLDDIYIVFLLLCLFVHTVVYVSGCLTLGKLFVMSGQIAIITIVMMSNYFV